MPRKIEARECEGVSYEVSRSVPRTDNRSVAQCRDNDSADEMRLKVKENICMMQLLHDQNVTQLAACDFP